MEGYKVSPWVITLLPYNRVITQLYPMTVGL